jgi:steroid 5-alpha reductase family enzyme
MAGHLPAASGFGRGLMEGKMHERRPGYGDYRRRVSAFVPMPPK